MNLGSLILVIRIFTDLKQLWESIGEDYKSIAYANVINELETNGYLTQVDDLNLTNAMKKKVNEILNTGKLQEVKFVKKVVKYSEIPGFGNKMIIKLIKSKSDIHDLNLNRLQQIGLKYHKKISTSLSRRDVENVHKKLSSILTESEKIFITGGYRRENHKMKDVDCLILGSSNYRTFIKKIKKSTFYEVLINSGPRKMTFLMKYKRNYIHVDIRFVTTENFPFALLYFTGSKIFNIRLRKKAKKMGFKLNEYGLYNRKTKNKINKTFLDEESIIAFLGFPLKYVNPKNRE